MTDNDGNTPVTEFTQAWVDFESRLGSFLRMLAAPTIYGVLHLSAPTGGDTPETVTVNGRMAPDIGVTVNAPMTHGLFFPLVDGVESMADAASMVCAILRDRWDVAHPSLLTAWVEEPAFGLDVAAKLGLGGPELIPDEVQEHERVRRVRRRLDRSAAVARSADGDEFESPLINEIERIPEAVFPTSPEHLRALIGTTLHRHLLTYSEDEDGDLVVEAVPIGGTRVFLSILGDKGLIRIWKSVVRQVNSRRAAVVEANYLNRAHPLTKWILVGHTLVQETYVCAAPFVSDRLIDALNDFDEQYDDNLSQLRLRLGGEER